MAKTIEPRTRGVLPAAVSAALFVLACMLPAVHLLKNQTEPVTYQGRALLYLGAAVAFAVGNLAWMANAFYAASLSALLLRQWSVATLMGLVALAFAAMSFQLLGKQVTADQTGANQFLVVSFGPGFYCWLVAMAAAAGGGIWRHWSRPRESAQ